MTLKLNEKENIKEISEFALHLARIISYPSLDIEYYLKKFEKMGEELKKKIKIQKK